MKPLSVYIHIPFCVQKCIYCNFTSFANKNECMEDYFKCLSKEIEQNAKLYKNYVVKTIFIGGGTPSCVDENYIEKVVNTLKQNYNFAKKIEFSIECNPSSLTLNKVKKFKELGVNRFSIGLQSANDKELKFLNRPHLSKDFADAVNYLKQEKIKNFNIDILLGIPHQTFNDLKQTLNFALNFKPTHLSCYGLIYEEGTPLFKMVEKGTVKPLSDNQCVKFYDYTVDHLKSKGYERYEVSNFCLKNKECKHNECYWTNKDYVGFGLSAHSKIKDKRFSNTDNLAEYLSNPLNYADEYVLTVQEKFTERIMLGLRMQKGVNIEKLNKEFKMDFMQKYAKNINLLKKNGFIVIENNYLKATDKGFKVLNSVIEKLT